MSYCDVLVTARANWSLARWAFMPSSVIRSFTYLPAERRLEIDFVSGRRYAYLDVPPDVVEAMRRSFAKGEFFNAHIRGHFRYARRVAAPQPLSEI